jgi:hypothetical protein
VNWTSWRTCSIASKLQDAAATAEAWEKGTNDPGSRYADRAAKALADAQRTWSASRIALDKARAGVVTAFDEHGDELEAKLRDELAQTADASSERLDGWLRLHGQMCRVARLLNIEDPFGAGAQRAADLLGARPKWLPHVVSVKVPCIGDGDVLHVADVVESLRQLGRERKAEVPNPAAHQLKPAESHEQTLCEAGIDRAVYGHGLPDKPGVGSGLFVGGEHVVVSTGVSEADE